MRCFALLVLLSTTLLTLAAGEIELEEVPLLLTLYTEHSFTGNTNPLSGLYNTCYNLPPNTLARSVTIAPDAILCDIYKVADCNWEELVEILEDTKMRTQREFNEFERSPGQVSGPWAAIPEASQSIRSICCWDGEGGGCSGPE